MGRPRNPAKPPRKPKKTPKTRAMSAVAQAAVAKMWAEIREKFETTPATIRELAREFGIKSHTTVLRRLQVEGWTKQPAPIAAHIATENIITEVLEAEKAPESASESPQSAPIIDHASTTKDSENSLEIAAKPHRVRPAPATGREEAAAEQRGAVKAAERMALVQQRQALMEIKLADQALGLSGKVLKLLETVMESEDLMEVQRCINRLTAFGEDTESFSGLLKTAIMGIEKAVNLRRRAIGMDVRMARGTSTDATPISAADLPPQVAQMLPTLSTDELMELRRAAVVMEKKLAIAAPIEAQNVIEGLAETILEGEG